METVDPAEPTRVALAVAEELKRLHPQQAGPALLRLALACQRSSAAAGEHLTPEQLLTVCRARLGVTTTRAEQR